MKHDDRPNNKACYLPHSGSSEKSQQHLKMPRNKYCHTLKGAGSLSSAITLLFMSNIQVGFN